MRYPVATATTAIVQSMAGHSIVAAGQFRQPSVMGAVRAGGAFDLERARLARIAGDYDRARGWLAFCRDARRVLA